MLIFEFFRGEASVGIFFLKNGFEVLVRDDCGNGKNDDVARVGHPGLIEDPESRGNFGFGFRGICNEEFRCLSVDGRG